MKHPKKNTLAWFDTLSEEAKREIISTVMFSLDWSDEMWEAAPASSRRKLIQQYLKERIEPADRSHQSQSVFKSWMKAGKSGYKALKKTSKTNPNVQGPFFVVDCEGTVRAEGICCLDHAKIVAKSLENSGKCN